MPQLRVELIQARNLVARDINLFSRNSSDPYVILICGNEKFKSNTVFKNLNPVWNQTFLFRYASSNSFLTLKLYDYDLLSADDPLGSASVNLNTLYQGVTQDLWVPLNTKGQVHLRLTAIDFGLSTVKTAVPTVVVQQTPIINAPPPMYPSTTYAPQQQPQSYYPQQPQQPYGMQQPVPTYSPQQGYAPQQPYNPQPVPSYPPQQQAPYPQQQPQYPQQQQPYAPQQPLPQQPYPQQPYPPQQQQQPYAPQQGYPPQNPYY